jgi:hypothetical protein
VTPSIKFNSYKNINHEVVFKSGIIKIAVKKLLGFKRYCVFRLVGDNFTASYVLRFIGGGEKLFELQPIASGV